MVSTFEFDYKETAIEDLDFWKKHDPKIIKRIEALLKSMKLTPYTGIGKPEQLRYDLAGYWSRRINKEHRIIYRVNEDKKLITIHSFRSHYERKMN